MAARVNSRLPIPKTPASRHYITKDLITAQVGLGALTHADACSALPAFKEEPGFGVSPGRHYINCGGVILSLYSPRADGDPVDPRPNFEHIYFAVADLEAAYRRAESVGGLSKDTGDGNLPMGRIAQRPWGERSFYLRDRFGNPLCFVDETTLFTR